MNSTVVVYLSTCHEEKVFGVTILKRFSGKNYRTIETEIHQPPGYLMAISNNTEIEKKLWEAADELSAAAAPGQRGGGCRRVGG